MRNPFHSPWQLRWRFGPHTVLDAEGETVAVVYGTWNAALVTAAPDLLEAAKALSDYLAGAGGPGAEGLVHAARVAIDRAEGRPAPAPDANART